MKTHLKSSHVPWVASIFETVLIALQEELEEEAESTKRCQNKLVNNAAIQNGQRKQGNSFDYWLSQSSL